MKAATEQRGKVRWRMSAVLETFTALCWLRVHQDIVQQLKNNRPGHHRMYQNELWGSPVVQRMLPLPTIRRMLKTHGMQSTTCTVAAQARLPGRHKVTAQPANVEARQALPGAPPAQETNQVHLFQQTLTSSTGRAGPRPYH